jgi:hypothetical protein
MLELMPGRISPTGLSLYGKVTHILARQGSKLLGPYFSKGSAEKTQVYLIMSHDSRSIAMRGYYFVETDIFPRLPGCSYA